MGGAGATSSSVGDRAKDYGGGSVRDDDDSHHSSGYDTPLTITNGTGSVSNASRGQLLPRQSSVRAAGRHIVASGQYGGVANKYKDSKEIWTERRESGFLSGNGSGSYSSVIIDPHNPSTTLPPRAYKGGLSLRY